MAHTLTNRRRVLIALLVLALPAMTAAFVALHPFDDDEFQHAHYAWLLHHGQRPFRDFFEHHLPAYHLLAAPVYTAVEAPESLFALRGVSWACLLAALACVYGASRALCSGPAGPIAALLLLSSAPIFLTKMLEARPEAPAVLCFAAALRLLFARRRDGDPRAPVRLALAGLLAGAMPAFSHKFGLSAAALLAGAFLLVGARRGLLFMAASVLPISAVLAWAATQGILGDLYRNVFVLGVEWKHRFSPSGYLTALWSDSALLVTAGLAGLLLMAGEPARARRQAAVLFMALAAGTATLFLVPEPYRQSFLPLFPLLAIGAAVTADRAWRSILRATAPPTDGAAVEPSPQDDATRPIRFPGAVAAALLVLAAAALYPSAISLAADLKQSPSADLRRMRAADATGSPRYFDGRGLLFYRPHTGRHACMHQGIQAMLDPAGFSAESIAALRASGFPTVILDYRVLQMPAEIVSFIREHYLPVGDDVFVPGFRIDRSRLVGRPCRVQVPVEGLYNMSWRGGKVQCDGRAVTSGAAVPLAAGEHVLEGAGFVEGFAAILVRRTEAGRGILP